jgi:hypothetical protein
MNIPADLIPGDICLYATGGFVDKVIEIKEGSDVAHIEIFAGGGKSWASRNGIGVGLYPFRPDGLVCVRRPNPFFKLEAVESWFKDGIDGIPYGFGDILANIEDWDSGPWQTDLRQCDGVDCSHFAAALLEVGGCAQFDEHFPKNKITPRDSKLSKQSRQIYPYLAGPSPAV